MKRVSIALLLSLVLAAPTMAGRNECIIDPNPVPFGTEFTITAQLDPGKAYDIRIEQDDKFGHHDDGVEFADETGLWVFTYILWDDPRDGLTLGDFVAQIRPSNRQSPKGSGGARCSGTVVP